MDIVKELLIVLLLNDLARALQMLKSELPYEVFF